MDTSMFLRALVSLALVLTPSAAAPQDTAGGVEALVLRLQEAAAAGDTAAIRALGDDDEVPGLEAFARLATPAPTRFVVKERDRAARPSGERLLLEVFTQHGTEAGITTWRVDVTAGDGAEPRRISEIEQLTTVSGLHRLALNPLRQFDVKNLTVRGTDLTLELRSGSAFVAETPEGPTAVVLLGRGRMRFAPADPAEHTQLRIFGGADALTAEFDAVFVRVRPSEFADAFDTAALVPRAVAARQFRRASDVFDDYVGQTLHLDLTDLSRDRWSLLPPPGDLIVEVRTRRHGSLTYTRSGRDAEDITLFDRRQRRNISVYASERKLAARGRFYSEDDLVDYDVQHYEVDATFTPDRLWMEGSVRIRIRVRSYLLSSLTLRLAESLTVRTIASPEHGRLLHLRVVGQSGVIINFPAPLRRDSELWLYVQYGGRLPPQQIDREGIAVTGQETREQLVIPPEPQFLYSNRSYWYPQAGVSDYATASLRLTVPAEYDVVATGTPAGPPEAAPAEPGQQPGKVFRFDAERPVRYLACVVSRFREAGSRQIAVPPGGRLNTQADGLDDAPRGRPAAGNGGAGPAGQTGGGAVTLTVVANPRQTSRARTAADLAASILGYYGALMGGVPYPDFTLAVTESDLPGGHSPAYFAVLNQQLPTSPLFWRNDPVAFENYPPFFLAHEIAHQWWGQAIGWKNYHEQWLSEGFAQYFAAMYAAQDRGDEFFVGMLRQMRRWAVEHSPQGPVYLGYRLGHIRGEGRVFRALVYNKGAMVAHMLRRLLGDDAFLAGLRAFYEEWKYRKAGTDDLRETMERVSGMELSAFFEGWIYGWAVPQLQFSTAVGDNEARIRLEHTGEVIPVPVTVSVIYTDGRSEEVVVAVTEAVAERTLPLTGSVRTIEVNRDHGAVAEISRQRGRPGGAFRIAPGAAQGR